MVTLKDRLRFQRDLVCLIVALPLLGDGIATALAQTAPANPSAKTPRHNSHSVPGTPLDTIMNSHLTTSVAPAQDFVKETRPDLKTLNYAPLTGSDPERPKPRDAANVAALQAELEQSAAKNEGRARGFRPAGTKHRKESRETN